MKQVTFFGHYFYFYQVRKKKILKENLGKWIKIFFKVTIQE